MTDEQAKAPEASAAASEFERKHVKETPKAYVVHTRSKKSKKVVKHTIARDQQGHPLG